MSEWMKARAGRVKTNQQVFHAKAANRVKRWNNNARLVVDHLPVPHSDTHLEIPARKNPSSWDRWTPDECVLNCVNWDCAGIPQVHIINLLQDSKFQHFKPVMDTYIESHFAGALSYRCVTSWPRSDSVMWPIGPHRGSSSAVCVSGSASSWRWDGGVTETPLVPPGGWNLKLFLRLSLYRLWNRKTCNPLYI